MQKKVFFTILMLLLALLTGAVGKHYAQKQMADGSATLTVFEKIVVLGDVDYKKIAEVCAKKEYGCSADEENFSVSVQLEKGKYYKFNADYGLPDITYTLELNSIATDLLTERTLEILKAAGQPAAFGAGEPTDLTEKDEGLARMLRTMGDIYYTVEMPGEVVETNVGSKSGNSVTFMLSQAYMKDGAIIIKSRQLNAPYIIGALMILILTAVSASFLRKKQEAKKETTYQPKRGKATRKKA